MMTVSSWSPLFLLALLLAFDSSRKQVVLLKPTIQEEKIKRESRSVPEFLSAISDLQLLPLSSQIEET
ncbi:hypothetical protein AAC387_Pa04g2452 [Persea americana]